MVKPAPSPAGSGVSFQRMPPPPVTPEPRNVKRVRVAVWTGVALLCVGALGATAYHFRESSDDAFYAQWGVDRAHLPYDAKADARREIAAAKARAAASGKMLMVTFGANWCPDCLTLHRDLEDPVTRDYAHEKFEMVNVDVGEFGKNSDVARELGVTVNGIPLAVFYSSDGRPIGDTTGGELEPSRHYTSREILDFLKEVAEHRRVVSPDQRQ
jgi:thiol-disulfide isomerase/thioredoxin